MNDPATPPAAAQPSAQAQPQIQITDAQVKDAARGALEILSGAPTSRVLELTDQIVIARMVLRAISRGELIIARPATGPAPLAIPDAQPVNRAERRAARHKVAGARPRS